MEGLHQRRQNVELSLDVLWLTWLQAWRRRAAKGCSKRRVSWRSHPLSIGMQLHMRERTKGREKKANTALAQLCLLYEQLIHSWAFIFPPKFSFIFQNSFFQLNSNSIVIEFYDRLFQLAISNQTSNYSCTKVSKWKLSCWEVIYWFWKQKDSSFNNKTKCRLRSRGTSSR